MICDTSSLSLHVQCSAETLRAIFIDLQMQIDARQFYVFWHRRSSTHAFFSQSLLCSIGTQIRDINLYLREYCGLKYRLDFWSISQIRKPKYSKKIRD